MGLSGAAAFIRKLERIQNLGRELVPTVDQYLLILESAAKKNASGPRPQHIDKVTSNLVNSIKSSGASLKGLSITGDVSVNVIYAKIHEFGGVIVPINGPYLTWQTSDGKWHRATMVIIPPRPYMYPALEETKSIFTQMLTDKVHEVFA